MAKTITLKSGSTVEWGVPTAHLQADMGVVKSVKINKGGKEKEYPGEDGEAVAHVLYDAKDELTLEILAKTSATVPARGSVLTHATVKYLVLSVALNWANEDAQSFTVTARTFAAITLT
jgi:hypothetical protein